MLILKAEIKHNLVKSNGTPAKILDIQGTNFFQPMILLLDGNWIGSINN